MLYPINLEIKLGFDQIREMIRENCLSPLGQAYVQKIQFSSDFDMVEKLLNQADEFIQILQTGLSFPIQNYIDVIPGLNKLRPEGAFLSPEEFRDIKASLKTVFSCVSFFDTHEEGFPTLAALRGGIQVDKALLREIERVIDDNGTVKSNASPALEEIRRKMQGENGRIRKELDRIIKNAKNQGYTDEDLSVTIRGGRMVIPVKAEYKRNVKGFIQDESASGQTVFIEPAEVLEINNAIRELEYAERREIIKILIDLASKLRPSLPELRRAYVFLGILDFIRAKAKVALELGAIKPYLQKKPLLKVRKARHPLLFIAHKKQDKPVVPLDIDMDQQQRIVVISGPNAGGKSVSLKTVGLIQYMLQCGLPVPVDEGSTIGVFDDIFIDIGDEQSLENDLSTYSSHLKNMKHFLFYSGKKSLVLIDEFGTGTEPHFGGAIAEAVLEKLNENKVFGIITTHYANLKTYAEQTDGVVNAAMLFDMHKLEPLYVLQIGSPGSSFALEIATKTGIPRDVIDSAKAKVGEERVNYDRLIKDLEKEKGKFRRNNHQLKSRQKELEEELKSYQENNEFLDTHRKKLMNEAKQEAKALVYEANQKIEETIRQIKESKADKEATRNLRKDLEGYSRKLKPEFVKEKEPEFELEGGEISEGDSVKVVGQNAFGEVLSIKGKEAEISIGSLKSKVKLNRLQKVSRKEYRKQVGEAVQERRSRGLNMNDKFSEFSPNVDIRGMRAEEALPLVDSLIDNAILFSVPEVKIVHGKGSGILRTVIREHLRNFSQIKDMEDEHADKGGAGVTVVRLK